MSDKKTMTASEMGKKGAAARLKSLSRARRIEIARMGGLAGGNGRKKKKK